VSTADEGAANRGDGPNRPVGEFDGGGDAARYEVGDAVALGHAIAAAFDPAVLGLQGGVGPVESGSRCWGEPEGVVAPSTRDCASSAQSKGARHAFGPKRVELVGGGRPARIAPGMAEPCADSRPDS
jgi:hypothetical protein